MGAMRRERGHVAKTQGSSQEPASGPQTREWSHLDPPAPVELPSRREKSCPQRVLPKFLTHMIVSKWYFKPLYLGLVCHVAIGT